MAKKVMVAMSGGVDSSMAAALLCDRGYEVCGATLKLFSGEEFGLGDEAGSCCSLSDVADARSVADRLGFDHHVFQFGDRFRRDVIDRFAASYARGATPNPCIDCNRYIKFDKLLERADLLGMDCIATGHYARIEQDPDTGRYLLKKAADETKDQTYVLYAMTQRQLSRTLFPLGNLRKGQVRTLAAQRGLITAQKPDSQDICFVPDGDYAAFLEEKLGIASTPGDFTDASGKVLGTHKGIAHYTVGQRRGLGLSLGAPVYVVAIDAARNRVVVGEESELYRRDMLVKDINWISVARLDRPVNADVKIRYSKKAAPAALHSAEDGRVLVRFREPQRAVTPGQAAVFYMGDAVLGGGVIV